MRAKNFLIAYLVLGYLAGTLSFIAVIHSIYWNLELYLDAKTASLVAPALLCFSASQVCALMSGVIFGHFPRMERFGIYNTSPVMFSLTFWIRCGIHLLHAAVGGFTFYYLSWQGWL